MTEQYTFLAVITHLLREHMPNLPMRFRYRRGGEDGDEPTSLLLERCDGRRFVVTVRELASVSRHLDAPTAP
jgi:hypothetical protein